MLNIYFGDMPGAIYYNKVYFDNTYEEEWITDDFSRKVIKDIDKAEVIGPNCIKHPILGQIPTTHISTGTKSLILMNYTDKIFNDTMCGDNCAKWIIDIASRKDLTITLHHIMDFGINTKFDIKILNSGNIIHNDREYISEATEWSR